jgi:hypothetical protein
MNQESQRSRNLHISSSGFQIRAEFGARLNTAFFLVTAATRTAARKNSLFDGGWSLRGPIGPFFNFLRHRTNLAQHLAACSERWSRYSYPLSCSV